MATREREARTPSGEVVSDDDPRQKTPPKGVTKQGLLQTLGPGLITGASDDDPSGIATYSQVGAQFGYGLLWTMLFSYPLMAGIQEISAQIGRVTGRGIAGNLRRHYAPAWLYGMVGLVLVANIINLGADIGAMGAAVNLLVGGPALLYAALFAVASVVLESFLPYDRYAHFLKWLTLALFAYVATVFVVHVPWGHALRATVVPSFSWKPEYVTSIVAVLGTTISPYLFWADHGPDDADGVPAQSDGGVHAECTPEGARLGCDRRDAGRRRRPVCDLGQIGKAKPVSKECYSCR